MVSPSSIKAKPTRVIALRPGPTPVNARDRDATITTPLDRKEESSLSPANADDARFETVMLQWPSESISSQYGPQLRLLLIAQPSKVPIRLKGRS